MQELTIANQNVAWVKLPTEDSEQVWQLEHESVALAAAKPYGDRNAVRPG